MLKTLFIFSVLRCFSGCDSDDRIRPLLGLDADKDCVRDDIQGYIEGLDLTEQRRYFVRNCAALKQELFLVYLEGPDAVLATSADLG